MIPNEPNINPIPAPQKIDLEKNSTPQIGRLETGNKKVTIRKSEDDQAQAITPAKISHQTQEIGSLVEKNVKLEASNSTINPITPDVTQKKIEELLDAIEKDHTIINSLPPELKNSKQFLLAASARNGKILPIINSSDSEIILTCLLQCDLLRKDFDTKLLNHDFTIKRKFDKTIIYHALLNNSNVFQYLREEFRDNWDFYNLVVRLSNNYKMIPFAGPHIKENPHYLPMLSFIFSYDREAFLFFKNYLKSNKSFALDLLKFDRNWYQYFPTELQEDREIVLKTITKELIKKGVGGYSDLYSIPITDEKALLKIINMISKNGDHEALFNYALELQQIYNSLIYYYLFPAQLNQLNTLLKIERASFELAAKGEGSFKPKAAYQYGFMCLAGLGGEIDQKQGIDYLKIAIESHSADAAYLLGIKSLQKLIDNVDEREGIDYLKMAAKWGSTEAMRTLAIYYHIRKNPLQAQVWKNEFSKIQLQTYAPRISKVGGTLLTYSDNSQFIETFKFLHPNFKEELLSKYSKLSSISYAQERIENHEGPNLNTLSNGICAGVVIDLITRVKTIDPNLTLNEFENQLITLAKRAETHSSITAIATHCFYSSFSDKFTSSPNIKRHEIFHQKGPLLFTQEEFKRKIFHEKNLAAYKHIYKIKGLHLTPLTHLGLPGSLSDIDYLRRWFTDAQEGAYPVSISTVSKMHTDHSIAFFKKGDQIYVFDPNYGLFKCSSENPLDTINQFLSTTYPSNQNHNIVISQINSLQGLLKPNS